MIIRKAIQTDWPDIKRLMIDFANANPVEDLQEPQYSEKHTDAVLHTLTTQGVMLVAEDNNRVVGMLLSLIQGDIWLPKVKRLHEIAWWVEEEYRNTTAGARLLKEYISIGIDLKEAGHITNFTLTTLATTPDMKLQDRGWQACDYNWVWRGK